MAIPGKTAPVPQQSRLYYQPGTGLTSRPVSVPTKQIQKSLGAAGKSNSLVAIGTGSTSTAVVNLQSIVEVAGFHSYTTTIPINLPTPLTSTSAMSLIAGVPVVSGLWGMAVKSLVAQPLMILSGQTIPLDASAISAGVTVTQFLIAVTVGWTGVPITLTNLVVNCSGSLVTT